MIMTAPPVEKEVPHMRLPQFLRHLLADCAAVLAFAAVLAMLWWGGR